MSLKVTHSITKELWTYQPTFLALRLQVFRWSHENPLFRCALSWPKDSEVFGRPMAKFPFSTLQVTKDN